jgi:hypothetical protein
MNVAARAHGILARPSAEWTRIGNEPSDAAYLLTGYVAVLAVIPAAFGLIGACVVGWVVPGVGTVRATLLDGAFGAIFGYVATCAIVLMLGIVINVLAPLFGGERNFDNAFKLAVYSYTPVWLAGVFLLAPGLRFLLLTSLYGVFILWRGLPKLMKPRSDKVSTYTTVVIVFACALTLAAAWAQHTLFGVTVF